jgi:hypothetical protein
MYEELERRALFDMPEDDPAEDAPPDLVASITGTAAEADRDVTLGGYIEKHDRVPAFEGADGQPYTVDVDVEEDDSDDGQRWVSFLVFIRWAATGAGIMDHLESGDVARGSSEEEARRGALQLSLYEIRAELDAAIQRRRADLED